MDAFAHKSLPKTLYYSKTLYFPLASFLVFFLWVLCFLLLARVPWSVGHSSLILVCLERFCESNKENNNTLWAQISIIWLHATSLWLLLILSEVICGSKKLKIVGTQMTCLECCLRNYTNLCWRMLMMRKRWGGKDLELQSSTQKEGWFPYVNFQW